MSMPMLDPVMHDPERLALELAELEERKRLPVRFDVRDPEFHRLLPDDVHVERVATGVGGDQHATVVDLHQPAVADDLNVLAGQPRPRLVGGGGEADGAFRAHAGAADA